MAASSQCRPAKHRLAASNWPNGSSRMPCRCVFKCSCTRSCGRRISAGFDIRCANLEQAMTNRATLDLLQAYESRNVTFIEPDGSWPIVWSRARGVHVWDEQGKRYLDLTAAFGVAAAGHANRRVVAAAREQMGQLLHAMGDVHPHRLKAELARELSRITFERWTASARGRGRSSLRGKTIFCNSGFEAVEAALKTALLATRRPGIIVFNGAY